MIAHSNFVSLAQEHKGLLIALINKAEGQVDFRLFSSLNRWEKQALSKEITQPNNFLLKPCGWD